MRNRCFFTQVINAPSHWWKKCNIPWKVAWRHFSTSLCGCRTGVLVLVVWTWMPITIILHLGGGFKYFFIFTPNLGEDEPNLTSIFFQMGWNHQLVVVCRTGVLVLVLRTWMPIITIILAIVLPKIRADASFWKHQKLSQWIEKFSKRFNGGVVFFMIPPIWDQVFRFPLKSEVSQVSSEVLIRVFFCGYLKKTPGLNYISLFGNWKHYNSGIDVIKGKAVCIDMCSNMYDIYIYIDLLFYTIAIYIYIYMTCIYTKYDGYCVAVAIHRGLQSHLEAKLSWCWRMMTFLYDGCSMNDHVTKVGWC